MAGVATRVACLTTALLAGCAATGAASSLTLDNTTTTTIYQQTQNSPCVIGDPSCNNPSGFGYTLIPAGTFSWDTSLTSPAYTVGQIEALLGSSQFSVGIDVNSTHKPLATEYLVYFEMWTVGGALLFDYTPSSPTQLLLNNQGNGFSDGLLTGFDVSALLDSTQVYFTAMVDGATAGREEFFLIGGAAIPCSTNPTDAHYCPPAPEVVSQVPESGTWLLLGSGLSALAVGLRRRAQKS